MGEEAERAEAVVQRDDDGAFACQAIAGIARLGARAAEEAAAVQPDHDGPAVVGRFGRRPDIQVEAVLARRRCGGRVRAAGPALRAARRVLAWPGLTPDHFATGCGGRQRFAPTGGAANGIPLKTPDLGAQPPSCRPAMPLSMVTSAGMAAKALVVAVNETAASSRRRIAIPPKPGLVRVRRSCFTGPHVQSGSSCFMQPFYANALRLSKPRAPWNLGSRRTVGGETSCTESNAGFMAFGVLSFVVAAGLATAQRGQGCPR